MNKKPLFAIVAALIPLLLSGCGSSTSRSNFAKANDILSYKAVLGNKPVITIGKNMWMNSEALESGLEKKFPNIDFVIEETRAGTNEPCYTKLLGENGDLEDIVFTNSNISIDNDYLYDLSAEVTSGRFNPLALNAVSVNGKLFQFPITNDYVGIAYNKTLFAEKGWTLPNSLDEFYTLCQTISDAGIRPFQPCLTYYSTFESTMLGLANDQIFTGADAIGNYNLFVNGKVSSDPLMAKGFAFMRDLYQRKLIVDGDFASSATTLRKDLFYKGKIAMLTNSTAIRALSSTEKAPIEVGFMGFPNGKGDGRYFHSIYGNRLAVTKSAMADASKATLIRSVLDFLTTPEGQETLIASFSGISALEGYEQNFDGAFYDDIKAALKQSHIFYGNYFGTGTLTPSFLSYVNGTDDWAKLSATLDAFVPEDPLAALSKAPIGQASENFSVLETSFLNTDAMKESSGAEIALLLHDYYFTGNLARLYKGDITLPERFVLKNVAKSNLLSLYEITGANLKTLLEHPYQGGKEINAVYAFSGLRCAYAPWANSDQQVLSVTLADGTAIDDSKTYNVCGWDGSIDARYISKVVKTYPEAKMNIDVVTSYIQKHSPIAPVSDKRYSLDYSKIGA